MRTLIVLSGLCLLAACGEESEPEDAYGRLVQALGLGSGTGTGNGLGVGSGVGNGLGTPATRINPETGQPVPATPPSSGTNSPGAGSLGSTASCADACRVLISCGLDSTQGECTQGCNADLGSAGATGAALLQCIANASCASIRACIPDDDEGGPSNTTEPVPPTRESE